MPHTNMKHRSDSKVRIAREKRISRGVLGTADDERHVQYEFAQSAHAAISQTLDAEHRHQRERRTAVSPRNAISRETSCHCRSEASLPSRYHSSLMTPTDRVLRHSTEACRQLAHLVDSLGRRHAPQSLQLNRQSFIGCVGRVGLHFHYFILPDEGIETER